MKRCLVIAFMFLTSWASAQQVEPVRYEINRWNKEQGSHFQSFGEQGGLMVIETEKTDKDKRRLWSFACLDTSLYETRNDLIPLPDKLKFIDAGSNDRFATFFFCQRRQQESLGFA